MGKKRPGRAWFLSGVIPLAIGTLLVVHACSNLHDKIVGMTRIPVPGETDVQLEAGDHVLYGETESEIDGKAYASSSFSVRCSLTAEDGTPVALSTGSSSSSYTLYGYSGKSMFDASIPHAGTYHLACDGKDGGVIALGTGIGGSIVLAVLGGLAGGFGTVLVIVLVAVLRYQRRPVTEPVRSPY